MGESASLRAKDYRSLFKLVGECLELGADPLAWRLHLLARLDGCLGARVGMNGEFFGVNEGRYVPAPAADWGVPQQLVLSLRGRPIPLAALDSGWDDNGQRQAMFEWFEHQAATGAHGGLLPVEQPTGTAVVRRDVMKDRQWYNSPQFNDYLRRSEVDDLVVSFQRIDDESGRFDCLTVFRALGERPFSRRDGRFLEVLHRELAPLIGRHLACTEEPSAMLLSPQRRRVLDCLLEGDSEKQIAARLDLTQQTVHQYVKAVYRHFRVGSRAELMARWIRLGNGHKNSRLPHA